MSDMFAVLLFLLPPHHIGDFFPSYTGSLSVSQASYGTYTYPTFKHYAVQRNKGTGRVIEVIQRAILK